MKKYLDSNGLSYLWSKITSLVAGKKDVVPIVDHGTSDTTFALTPNVFHVWGEVSSLDLTLATPSDSTVLNEYRFEFESPSTATVLNLPASVKWATSINIEAHKIYQAIIVNGIGRMNGVVNTYTVSGVVTDGTNALSGVVVTLGEDSVTTGSDGAFEFEVEAGAYTLSAVLDGCTFDDITITVNADTTQNIVMTRIYDAQVEYLQSSGTQYIELACTASAGDSFEVGGEIIPIYYNAQHYAIMGATPYKQFQVAYYSGTSSITYSSSVGGSAAYGAMSLNVNTKDNFVISTSKVQYGTTTNELSRPLTAAITAFRIYGGYQNVSYRYPVAFCSFYIKKNDVLLYDLIPVRVGTTGYMYDKVSGELFGNDGSGAFICGTDL